MYVVIGVMIVAQTYLLGAQKYYIPLFGKDISLLDGVLPTACVLAVFWVFFSSRLLWTWLNGVRPLIPYGCWVVVSLIIHGATGSGPIRLSQSLVQVLACYIGFAYTASERHDDCAAKHVSRIFQTLIWVIIVADGLYICVNGVWVQSGLGEGRYNTTYGTYVMVSYYASLALSVLATEWLWIVKSGRRLYSERLRLATGALAALMLLTVGGARTPLAAGIAAVMMGGLLLGAARRLLLLLSMAGTLFWIAFANGAPLRFLSVETGGPAVNTNPTGRDVWYLTVWQSAMRHVWTGGGAGSADALVFSARDGMIYSTHSQHLEIFHDFGVVGSVLFVVGLITMTAHFAKCARRAQANSSGRLLSTWAAIYCVHLFVSMFLDSIFPASLYYGNFGALLLGAALCRNDVHGGQHGRSCDTLKHGRSPVLRRRDIHAIPETSSAA